MLHQEKFHFIIVEDSVLDSFIAEKIIKNFGDSCLSFRSFSDPFEALEYIENRTEIQEKTIVFLDIQMPLMTGFEFIDRFESVLPTQLQKNFKINILSSSINEKDIITAKSYTTVHAFLNKPLTKEMVNSVL